MTTIPTKTAGATGEYWETYTHQPHWRNNEDEFEAAKFGMWLFLATELLLFSGFFCAYFVLRHFYPESFFGAARYYLNWKIGAINTAILLISSWNVAVAVRAAQLGQKMILAANVFFASLCGVAFLVIKLALEYIPKIQAGEVPGANFSYYGGHGYDPSAFDPVFLSVYWVSTATHGFHVLIGVFLLWWVGFRALKGHFGPKHYTAVENVGLYWHLVDLIWIFLFPLLYLVP